MLETITACPDDASGGAEARDARIGTIMTPLQAEQEHCRALSDQAMTIAGLLSATGAIIDVSPSVQRLLGYRPEDVRGQTGCDFLHPHDRPAMSRAMADILRPTPGAVAAVAARFRHYDRSWRTFAVVTRNCLHDPAIGGIVFTATDLTAHGQIDEALRSSEARFRSFYEHAPIGMMLMDVDGRPLMASAATQRILGYDEDALRRMTIADVSHPDDVATSQALFGEVLAGTRDYYTLDKRYIHQDGHLVWCHVAVSVTRDAAGTPQSIIAMLLDVTERRAAEERLRHSEMQYRRIVETAQEGIWQLDAEHCTTFANKAMADLLGYTVDEMQGMSVFAFVAPEDIAATRTRLEQRRHGIVQRTEVRYRHKDGHLLHAAISANAVYTPEGTYLGALALVTDITERKRTEEELRHLALYDALTGLPNRSLLQDRVEQAIRVAQRDEQPLALMLLDLDRFKEVNDTFGHHHGDLLLQQVAARVRTALRAGDTVARLGGDEFAVLLAADKGDGARTAAEKICAALDTPFVIDGHDHIVHVGVSIGIALFPDHGLDAEALLRRADVAMYVAKRSRTTCAIYSPEQDRYTPERLALIADLRQAITLGELVLHYQPKVDLATGSISSVEALVRWPHPQHGLVRPDRFIPLAEEAGLMVPLTWWVLEEALAQCQRWQRDGIELSVAVNVSMASLHDPQLPDRIAALLQYYAVSPAHLRIEVTESALMADVSRTHEVLGQLAAMGLGISVDDYGTGYSSLAYLKRLPVDELKIDMSFVRHMCEDEADSAIVASTIGLGHSLRLRVVAEGVEDLQTRETLVALGCDAAQGYHWSRPLPAAEMLQWARGHLGIVAEVLAKTPPATLLARP